jgi:hypothetical protein
MIALPIGVFGTTALTWTLMALPFRSSREGWDEGVNLPEKPDRT